MVLSRNGLDLIDYLRIDWLASDTGQLGTKNTASLNEAAGWLS